DLGLRVPQSNRTLHVRCPHSFAEERSRTTELSEQFSLLPHQMNPCSSKHQNMKLQFHNHIESPLLSEDLHRDRVESSLELQIDVCRSYSKPFDVHLVYEIGKNWSADQQSILKGLGPQAEQGLEHVRNGSGGPRLRLARDRIVHRHSELVLGETGKQLW